MMLFRLIIGLSIISMFNKIRLSFIFCYQSMIDIVFFKVEYFYGVLKYVKELKEKIIKNAYGVVKFYLIKWKIF